MKPMLTTLLAAGLALTTTMASAVEHVVYIENKYMFPMTIYISNNDTIKFINNGSKDVRLNLSNGSTLISTIPYNQTRTISASTVPNWNATTLSAPLFYSPPYRWGSTGSWGSYSGAQGMSIERANAPTSCPDSRLSSSVCP